MSERRQRVAVAGAGHLGRKLAAALTERCDVVLLSSSHDEGGGTWGCDLTSIPETEIALAGCDVVVFVAKTGRPPARLVQASSEDLDLIMADSVARAAPRTSCGRIVFFACGPADPRESVLRSSGVPVSVLQGGGADPVAALVDLVTSGDVKNMTLDAWHGGESASAIARPGAQVCSVQRFARPAGATAESIAHSYLEWLGHSMPLVRVERIEDTWLIRVSGVPGLVLRHAPGRSEPESYVLDVIGGALASHVAYPGRFEFRILTGGTEAVSALLGFNPSLPWPIYRATQAIVHRRVMRSFIRSLDTGATGKAA